MADNCSHTIYDRSAAWNHRQCKRRAVTGGMCTQHYNTSAEGRAARRRAKVAREEAARETARQARRLTFSQVSSDLINACLLEGGSFSTEGVEDLDKDELVRLVQVMAVAVMDGHDKLEDRLYSQFY